MANSRASLPPLRPMDTPLCGLGRGSDDRPVRRGGRRAPPGRRWGRITQRTALRLLPVCAEGTDEVHDGAGGASAERLVNRDGFADCFSVPEELAAPVIGVAALRPGRICQQDLDGRPFSELLLIGPSSHCARCPRPNPPARGRSGPSCAAPRYAGGSPPSSGRGRHRLGCRRHLASPISAASRGSGMPPESSTLPTRGLTSCSASSSTIW